MSASSASVDGTPMPSFRPILFGMAFGVLAPALMMVIGFGIWNTHLHEDAVDRELQDTVRALSRTLDRDVSTILSAMVTLAASPFLDSADLERFYTQTTALTHPFDGWVVLADGSGQQLLNTRRPLGEKLPITAAPDLVAKVFAEGKPIVSSVLYGKAGGQKMVSILVPVFRNGFVVSCLYIAFVPERQ